MRKRPMSGVKREARERGLRSVAPINHNGFNRLLIRIERDVKIKRHTAPSFLQRNNSVRHGVYFDVRNVRVLVVVWNASSKLLTAHMIITFSFLSVLFTIIIVAICIGCIWICIVWNTLRLITASGKHFAGRFSCAVYESGVWNWNC